MKEASKIVESIVQSMDCCEVPFFITGTKLAANAEWTIASNNLQDKLPLIWLLEVISERGFGKQSSLEREINAKIFFLDETDPSQFYTAEHRQNVVEPMQDLMFKFLQTMESMPNFAPITDFSFKTFSRFGVETEQGVLKNILDANLSGVALDLKIVVYKTTECCTDKN